MNVEMPTQTKNKNLSTEESRNFVSFVPPNTIKNDEFGDVSLRLFTFMNLKEYKKPVQTKHGALNRKKSIKQCKKKSVHKLPDSELMKQDSSGLIQMIEESRKKRQHFLQLIIDEQNSLTPVYTRKCKTPTTRKKQIVITPKANEKKPLTQRLSLGNNIIPMKSPKNTLFRARSSLGSIAQGPKNKNCIKQNLSSKKDLPYNENKSKMQGDEKYLLKKKQQLQKKLLEINQSLFLRKTKKTNTKIKTKNNASDARKGN